MGKVIDKGWWKDDDIRYKGGGWTVAVTLGLNEPTLPKGQWVSVSVPLAGEIVTINIGPRRWKRICDGEWVHSLTSRFNFDGEDVLLYWNFNLQTRYEVVVNDYQKTVTRKYRIFVGSLTDAHIQLTDPPKRQRPKNLKVPFLTFFQGIDECRTHRVGGRLTFWLVKILGTVEDSKERGYFFLQKIQHFVNFNNLAFLIFQFVVIGTSSG